ncbi:MAG: hypothetical protein HY319_01390 [Armatimonadetes bacterium]|nr:hypothetical protein [Armatimonadota bacterium]
MRPVRRSRGLSLLELMLAFVLILLVTLYLMSLFASGQRHNLRAQQYSTGVFLANDKLQELLALPADALDDETGAFSAPFQDYAYTVTVRDYEDDLRELEVLVRSPIGAVAMARTLHGDVRSQGLTVNPSTHQLALTVAGETRLGKFTDNDAGGDVFTMLDPAGPAPNPAAVAGQPGWNLLWVVDQEDGPVPFREASSPPWGAPVAVPSPAGLPTPRFSGAAMDRFGSRLYLADAANRGLWMLADTGTPSWRTPTPIAPEDPPLGAPAAVATDLFGSLVWVADREFQCLRKLLVTSTPPPYPAADLEAEPGVGYWHRTRFRPAQGMAQPAGVAMDPNGWAVYVLDQGALRRFVDDTGEWTVLSELPEDLIRAGPAGLAHDPFANVFYVNSRRGSRYKYTFSSDTWESF